MKTEQEVRDRLVSTEKYRETLYEELRTAQGERRGVVQDTLLSVAAQRNNLKWMLGQ